MKKMDFEVDFKDVRSKQDVILRLSEVFKLHDISGDNWDSFEDYFTNLDSDSEIIRNARPKPEKVHLVVKSIEDVLKISEKDYNILKAVLEDSTKRENRGQDDVDFSYEIRS